MSQAYYDIYVDEVLRLAKTMVIKAEANAVALNEYVTLQRGIVDPIDPRSWKYYMNMAGDYHPVDKMMTVISLDTLQRIEFTKENLNIHRNTKREYAYGSTYYNDLVRRYKDYNQEQLILGILNPVTITQEVIDAVDGTILWYDALLVESNETNLIAGLQTWLVRSNERWYNNFYQEVDDLYPVLHQGILYSFIPSTILNLRLANCKTHFAHTFHIRSYLASNNRLDVYLDNMTKKQQLYFYRNILYLNHNAGKQVVHDELVGKIMTDRGLPLAQWDIRHNLEDQPADVVPRVELYRTPVNLGIPGAGSDVRTVAKMLEAENPLAKENASVKETATVTITDEVQGSRFNDLPTKILESSVIDMTDATPYTLSSILLNNWMYWSYTGRYKTFLAVRDPKTGVSERIGNKEAFLLWLYVYNKARGVELNFLPKLEAWHILREPAPTKKELRQVSTVKYVSDAVIDALYRKLPDLPASIISSGSFYDTAHMVFEFTMDQRNIWSDQESFLGHAMTEGAAHRFYHDVPLDFGSTMHYEDYLININWADRLKDYSTLELDLLASALLTAGTGLDSINVRSLKEMQTAMLNLFRQLSSYSIQFLQSINDSALQMLDWVDIRLGDDETIAGDITHNGELPVDVLDVHAKANNEVEYDMVGALVEIDVHSEMNEEAEVDLTVEFAGRGDTEYQYQVEMATVRATCAGCNKYVLQDVIKSRTLTGYLTGKKYVDKGYMAFPDHYMKLTVLEALMLQLNAANNTFMYVNNTTFKHTGLLSPGVVKVLVTANPPKSTAELDIYSGSVEVTIALLDLASYFAGTTLKWDWPARPLDTYELVDWLAQATGIALSREEFVLEDIPVGSTSFALKATGTCLRWKGQVPIEIPASNTFVSLTQSM